MSVINGKRTKPIIDKKLGALISLELKGLNSICEHAGWTLGTGGFVNYSEPFRSAGMTDSKEGLGKWLMKSKASREQNVKCYHVLNK